MKLHLLPGGTISLNMNKEEFGQLESLISELIEVDPKMKVKSALGLLAIEKALYSTDTEEA